MTTILNLKCFKPFPKTEHRKCSKILKKLVPSIKERLPELKTIPTNEFQSMRICNSCYMYVYQNTNQQQNINEPAQSTNTTEISSPTPSTSNQGFLSPSSQITEPSQSSSTSPESNKEIPLKRKRLIEIINTITDDPVKLSRINSKAEQEKIKSAMQKIETTLVPEHNEIKYYNEFMKQLKDKFESEEKYSNKMQCLTALPYSMPESKIMQEFKCTKHMVKESKRLLSTKGALSKPDNKRGRPLDKKTFESVKKFYDDPEISRPMPGKKDVKTYRIDGEKIEHQKHLLLSTVKETYVEFKKINPDIQISLSKFAMLRPKYCVLLGSSGTHSICVCTIHQNIKLMMANANFKEITKEKYCTYEQCITSVLCKEPKSKCNLLECAECPGIDKLNKELEEYFEPQMMENDVIEFNQWVSTDRCDLVTYAKSVQEFLQMFMNNLKKLIKHDFITKQQYSFAKKQQEKLGPGEFFVSCDFAENYSFVIQNEAQGYHWNNAQATIHPFVIYYRGENNSLEHINFIVISNCMIHDSVAVNLYIDKLVEFLRTKFEIIKKIIYISDGAASQYKNKKNFCTVVHHFRDYQIECEWHFYATSHGKGPCDGIGGTVKRKAARASLSKEYEKFITTPLELYEWATTRANFADTMNFCYISEEEYTAKQNFLEDRYKVLKPIPGTRGYHGYIPTTDGNILAKLYSNSKNTFEFKLV